MAYFVFDLDATLAELDSVYCFLMTLKIKNFAPQKNNADYVEVLGKLDSAYNTFVAKVLEEEQSTFPLGILRPGILQVMSELDKLRRDGQLRGVIIYSNNGRLENLEFVRDLIALSLERPKDELITDLIHWGHPMRAGEVTGGIGSADKTWGVLKSIVDAQHPPKNGAVSDFTPESVYFFDDFISPIRDMYNRPTSKVEVHKIKAQLGANYNLVTPYTFNASANRIGDAYTIALEPITNNTDMAKFVILIRSILNEVPGTNSTRDAADKLKLIMNYIIKHTPNADNGIDKMMAAIENVRSKPPVAVEVAANGSSGGKRVTRRKRNGSRNSKTQVKKKLKWRP